MDTGFEFNTSDPVEKLEQIGKRCHDLHVPMDSLDHDMRKSKKAAELLLAELNEVQERNDELQEELAKSTGQLFQLSKERELLESEVEGGVDDDVFAETCGLLEHQLQDFIELFSLTREELRKHSVTLDEKGKHVSEVDDMVHKEVTSQKQSLEYMIENINRLESNEKEKHSESTVMRRNVSLLYDACSSSVAEIEKWKMQLVENGLAAPADMELNKEYLNFADVNNIFSSKAPFSLEEHSRNITQRLLEALKDFSSIQAQIIKGNQEEMKSTISNLQKEIHEKDIQKDRICAELVGQIKEAEASARSHLQDFHDLERRLEVMEEERNFLQQRVKELQEGEATLKQLEDKFRALNDTMTAKDQEIEVLMHEIFIPNHASD